MKDRWKQGRHFFLCWLFLLVFFTLPVRAEVKTANLLYSDGGTLSVLFTFDTEIVDLTLISPSGEVLTKASPSLSVEEGNLWATYQIFQAEEGQWQVSYDKGRNASIHFSRIDQEAGLWLQYATVTDLGEASATLSFLAESQDTQRYSYSIYACATGGEEIFLTSGTEAVGEERSLSLSLSKVSSGTYSLRVDVSYHNGVMDIFDTLSTEPFSYVNSNGPEALAYEIEVSSTIGLVTLRWEESGYEGFTCQVLEDSGKVIYQGDLSKDSNQLQFFVEEGVSFVSISLRGLKNQLLSQEAWKTVPMTMENSLSIVTPEVTNVRQGEIYYEVVGKSSLFLSHNGGEPTEFSVENSGSLSWNLVEGQNTVKASLQSSEGIFYAVEGEIYCDWIPPTLNLAEDLDGLSVLEKTIEILGKVSFGDRLTINEVAVPLDSEGNFSYVFSLESGANPIALVATDENGNSTTQVITIYQGSGETGEALVEEEKPWIFDYLPLLVTVGLSLFLVILVEVQRKQKQQGKNLPLSLVFAFLTLVMGGVSGYLYWDLQSQIAFSESLAFLDLAEFSVQEAMTYLGALAEAEAYLQKALTATGILFLLSCAVVYFELQKKKAP